MWGQILYPMSKVRYSKRTLYDISYIMLVICYMLYVTYCSLFSELAAHAESIKIDGIAVLAPMYYKCADIESLVEYLAGKT